MPNNKYMADEELITFDFKFDHEYKSVLIAHNMDSVMDFINKLPNKFKEHIFEMLEENKDLITFIPFKVTDGLYACVYKKIIQLENKSMEEDFTLYVFEEKKDMIDLLDRKPLGIEGEVEKQIRKGILNL